MEVESQGFSLPSLSSSRQIRDSFKSSLLRTLQQCENQNDSEKFMFDQIDFGKDQNAHDMAEDVLKEVLVELSQTPLTNFLPKTEILLKFSLICLQKKKCSESFPLTLCEELVECTPIQTIAENLFPMLEQILNLYLQTQKVDPVRLKFIALCVHLLHRLSRTLYPEVCGRLYLILARTLDFFDRSGTNSRGLVNKLSETRNIVETETDGISQKMEIDSEKKSPLPTNTLVSFHSHFISLQKRMRVYPISPAQITSHLKSLFTSIDVLFSVLEANPVKELDAEQPNSNSNPNPNPNPNSHLNPNLLLESQSLQALCKFFFDFETTGFQIESLNFRLTFYTQLLFYWEHLLLLNTITSVKATSLKLPQELIKNIEMVKQRIMKNIRLCLPTTTSTYLKSLTLTLEREKSFVRWKNEGCENFGKSTNAKEVHIPNNKKRKSIVPPFSSEKRFCLGSSHLDDLWNISPNNLECFKDDEYNHVPSIEVRTKKLQTFLCKIT
jgi:hypothetical protein